MSEVEQRSLVEGLAEARTIPEDVALAVTSAQGKIAPEHVKVLCATLGKGERPLTPTQVALYIAICVRKGIDPFTEGYAFANEEGGIAFGLRIDGMQALASRTGQLKSVKVETIFTDEKGGEFTSAGPGHKLAGARCTIEREGMTAPVVESAWMDEYFRKGRGWDKYPETMIRKVARAKALRVAFADALGGVYEPTEME